MKKDTTKRCQYCRDKIEVHHITRHERICYLNPENLRKISEYMLGGLHDAKVLKRASFYRWARANKVITSVWITTRMKVDNWHWAAYQLLIYSYLHGYISFEKVDLLLDVLTDGKMWLDDEEYKALCKEAMLNEADTSVEAQLSLEDNYMALLTALIIRAMRDVMNTEDDVVLDCEEAEETDEVNVIEDAVTFLQSFAPDVLITCIKTGNMVEEAFSYITDEELYRFCSSDQQHSHR